MHCYAPAMKASRRCRCDAQDELGMTCGVPRAAEMTGVGRVGIQSIYVRRAE